MGGSADAPAIQKIISLIFLDATRKGAQRVALGRDSQGRGAVWFDCAGRVAPALHPPELLYQPILARLREMASLTVPGPGEVSRGRLHMLHAKTEHWFLDVGGFPPDREPALVVLVHVTTADLPPALPSAADFRWPASPSA